jgi:hypothetical protein
MPGYITAQGARDLVAQWAAREDIQPFLDAIYGVIRERAQMGKTSTCFSQSTKPSEHQAKAVAKVLEANGYKVVINFANDFVISWDQGF